LFLRAEAATGIACAFCLYGTTQGDHDGSRRHDGDRAASRPYKAGMTIPAMDRRDETGPAVVATPTKGAGEENFPVGSWLLPRPLRRHVAAFYRFARTADDIADSPDLDREAKLSGLARMGAALDAGGDDRVDPIRASAAETGVGIAECRDLLVAFTRDARNQSCDTWADLLDYCRYSAHPVGRYLLRLHGEDPSSFLPGDALCAAFQILNHLQDCGDDWRNLRRLYVPRRWIEAAGGTGRFFDPAAVALRRPILDRCLDGADRLIETASLLPGRLRTKGLKAEVAVMLHLARKLSERLRKGDPLQARVALTKADFARALLPGVTVLVGGQPAMPSDAELVTGAVLRAGSSFAVGMRILRPDRRRAMYALYGFCRAVDDIADAPASIEEKRAELDGWRRELDGIYAGQGEHALGRELVDAVRRYALPREEFDLILEGMLIDAAPSVRIPDRAALAAYARRVAGAVGVLSCRIFGVPDPWAKEFAIYLGETLQITNILRDVDEDAEIDRLYLPLDRLVAAGVDPTGHARSIVADPRVADACAKLSAELDLRYSHVAGLVPFRARPALRSALIMQYGYERIFQKLKARGWAGRGERPRLSKRERLATIAAALRR
jgi:squalene synthase HpnC